MDEWGPRSRAGVVLAAGESARWGERPKALLPVNGELALERVVGTLHRAGISDVTVVVGAHSEEILGRFQGARALGVEWVIHDLWPRGRTGSIQAGLSGCAPSSEVLLWPVDHPFVRSRTLGALHSAGEEDALATWLIPEFEGRGGHPVLLKPPAWREVFDLAPHTPLRALLPRLGPQVRRIPVGDIGVVVNLNSASDLRRAHRLGVSVEE